MIDGTARSGICFVAIDESPNPVSSARPYRLDQPLPDKVGLDPTSLGKHQGGGHE